MLTGSKPRNFRKDVWLLVVDWLIVLALLALAVAVSKNALAADTHLVLHGVSKHSKSNDSGEPYNEVNLGLGVRYGSPEWGVQVSYLRNSYRRHSPYLGVEYMPVKVLGAQVGVGVGVTRNYPGLNSGGWTPFASIVMRWDLGRVAPTTRIAPPAPGAGRAAVLAAELGIKLSE